MPDLISVIIPVYNIAPYLDACLESVCQQTYNMFEILIIDDGSTDGSYQKCQQYAEKYPYITVLHQSHQGVSAARNLGIKKANGKYIAFVDGDDTIDVNYLETLEQYMLEDKYDIVFCACRIIDVKKNTEKIFSISENYSGVLQNDFNLLYTSKTRISIGTPVCKLFKRDIILKNNIQFNESMINHEDAVFTFTYLQECSRYYIINETFYNYFKHSRGSATESFNDKRLLNEIYFLKFTWQWLNQNEIWKKEEIFGYDVVAFISSVVTLVYRKTNTFSSTYQYLIKVCNMLLDEISIPQKTNKLKTKIVLLCLKNKILLPVCTYYVLKEINMNR